MISIETQYFSLTRNVLLAVGLWPYQRGTLAQFQGVVVLSTLVVTIVFNYIPLITSECNLDLFIEIYSLTFVFFAHIVKYNTFWINVGSFRFILDQIQHICDEIKDKNELAIVEKYGHISRCYTFVLAIYLIGSSAFFPIAQYLPNILDVLLPKNETRPRRMWFPAESLANQRGYLHLLRLNTSISLCVGNFIALGVMTVFISSQKYFCGMFAITSYRIERAMKIDVQNEEITSEGIIRAVDIHRRAMKLSKLMMSRFEVMLILLIILGIISTSLNLFRVFQIISLGLSFDEIAHPIVHIIVVLAYSFLINYIAQNVTDHNRQIFVTVYNIQWYKASLHVQRLIFFLLQKGTKDFSMNFGGMFIASIQCFATLTNASISYFTMLYTVHK